MRSTDLLEPRTDYAVAKAAATLLCQAEARKGLPITTVRVFSAYGPWEEPGRLMPTLVARGLEGRLPPLVAPDLKFHRAIGEHVGKTYSVTGELLSAEEHEKHLAVTLPNEEEKKFVANLMHEPGWIAPREEIVS